MVWSSIRTMIQNKHQNQHKNGFCHCLPNPMTWTLKQVEWTEEERHQHGSQHLKHLERSCNLAWSLTGWSLQWFHFTTAHTNPKWWTPHRTSEYFKCKSYVFVRADDRPYLWAPGTPHYCFHCDSIPPCFMCGINCKHTKSTRWLTCISVYMSTPQGPCNQRTIIYIVFRMKGVISWENNNIQSSKLSKDHILLQYCWCWVSDIIKNLQRQWWRDVEYIGIKSKVAWEKMLLLYFPCKEEV